MGTWDYLSWLEHGASNTKSMGSIPVKTTWELESGIFFGTFQLSTVYESVGTWAFISLPRKHVEIWGVFDSCHVSECHLPGSQVSGTFAMLNQQFKASHLTQSSTSSSTVGWKQSLLHWMYSSTLDH